MHYGFDKTTMEDISREAGVSKGSLYLVWSSRLRFQRNTFTFLSQAITPPNISPLPLTPSGTPSGVPKGMSLKSVGHPQGCK